MKKLLLIEFAKVEEMVFHSITPYFSFKPLTLYRKTAEQLGEAFDSMLLTIRLTQQMRVRMTTYDVDDDGKLEVASRVLFAEWVVLHYELSGIVISSEEKIRMRDYLVATYENDSNGIFSSHELANLFKSVQKGKLPFSQLTLSATLNEDCARRKMKRLSAAIIRTISTMTAISSGVTPMMRDKFQELVAVKGNKKLSLDEIVHLLQWIFENTPELAADYVHEFRQGWIDMDIVTALLLSTIIAQCHFKNIRTLANSVSFLWSTR